jgi:hypothetical protein
VPFIAAKDTLMAKNKTISHTFTLTDDQSRAMLEYLNEDEPLESHLLEPITDKEKLDILNSFTDFVNDGTIHAEHIAETLEWPDAIYDMLNAWSIDDMSYRQLTGNTYEVTIVFDMHD